MAISGNGAATGMVRIRPVLSSILWGHRQGLTACAVVAVGAAAQATAGWLIATTIVLPAVATGTGSAWFVFLRTRKLLKQDGFPD